MRFYTRKRRSPVIVIVSLIDILAILLIFFIVTTTFKKNLPQLRISLPESKSAEAGEARQDPLILAIQDENNLQLDGQAVPLEGLAGALKEARERSPDRPVAMQADEGVPFRVIITVIDALREAGIRNLPAFTRQPAAAP